MTYLGTYPLAGRFNTVEDENNPEENEELLETSELDQSVAVPLPDNSYDEHAVSISVDLKHVGFIPKGPNVPIFYLLQNDYAIKAQFVLGEEKKGNLGIWTELYLNDI